MFKQIILFLALFLVVVACNNSAPKKPKNLIPKQDMVRILIDAKLISSARNTDKATLKKNGVDIDTYVYKKHNIDSLQFALSNAYYAFYTKEYEAIYNAVADSLTRLTTALKKAEKREQDSLKAIQEEKKLKKRDTIGN